MATATNLPPLYVSYLRVSTDKQGEKGLGIAAQRETVRTYLDRVNHGAQLLEEFVEVESGRKSNRPQLTKALSRCNLAGAKLIIAKLDRLSRDVHFLTGLEKAGVDFVACDLPDANRLSIHIMAAVAQYEVERISERTIGALKAYKADYQKGKLRKGKPLKALGNPNGAQALRRAGKGNGAAVAVIKAKATEYAEKLRGELQEIRASGITTLAGIAAKLTERHVRPSNDKLGDKSWHPNSVRRLIARVGQTFTFRVHMDSVDYAIKEALASNRFINPVITRELSGEFVKVTIASDGAKEINPPIINSKPDKEST
ncbi:MAG: recombinase family protein [Aestuariivirga sp.]